MPSKSEFTWDWIIASCEQGIQDLSQSIGQDPKQSYQSQENYRRGFEALVLAVAELRVHPQLANNVPMKSLGTLRWFPQEGYEVMVSYDVRKLQYEVTIYRRDTVDSSSLIERICVHLSKLPDTVVALIEKAKDLPVD